MKINNDIHYIAHVGTYLYQIRTIGNRYIQNGLSMTTDSWQLNNSLMNSKRFTGNSYTLKLITEHTLYICMYICTYVRTNRQQPASSAHKTILSVYIDIRSSYNPIMSVYSTWNDKWMTWLRTNWLTDSLPEWLTNWLTAWLTDWMTVWLTDWLGNQSTSE